MVYWILVFYLIDIYDTMQVFMRIYEIDPISKLPLSIIPSPTFD